MTAVMETDYLVVGAGAMGMAFADTLLQESDARIVIVDRHGRPGGHWGDAYDYVRLHQPSAFYGVNSHPLGSGRKDTEGPNCGLYEMASGQELLDYFEAVMRERFLASGRVHYLPFANYAGEGEEGLHVCQSLRDGGSTQVRVKRKVVFATHTGTAVPSTHPPQYGVDPGVLCVSPNELTRMARPFERYTVIGAGKTGMDACMQLLKDGVRPERIRWIMPNDAWLIDRASVQPGAENLERFFGSLATQMECIAQAGSAADLFDLLESRGELLRLDPRVRPTKYRCATVSREEIAQLRTITNVVRLGRVRRIGSAHMVLEHGSVEVLGGELFIDCSACAIPARSPGPVFEGDTCINLHYVRTCAPTFSAALIAAVECRVEAGERNAMCQPVPPPSEDVSWLQMWAVSMENRRRWSKSEALMQWLSQSRLDYGSTVRDQVPSPVMQRYMNAVRAAVPRLPGLLQQAGRQPAAAPADCALRQVAGGMPVARLKARAKAASES